MSNEEAQAQLRPAEVDSGDYDVFLEQGFSPLAFANSLVLATNTSLDVEVDLDAPSRRLGYDLEEIERLIESIASDNYEELLDQASSVQHAQEALKPLKTSLDHVNFSYSKLQRDVVKPYEKAFKLHTALKKLHQTSSMLRALTWYLYLARQLATLMGPETSNSNYRAALSLKEVQKQLEVNPSLKSLQIVRAHENSLAWVEDHLKSQSQHKIRTFTMVQDTTDVSYAFLTLYLLDPSSLVMAVDSFLRAQVTSAVTNVSRSLPGSISAIEGAVNDARNRARSLNAITSALESSKAPTEQREDVSGHETPGMTLLTFIKSSLDIKSMISDFWRDVASELDGRTREFVSRNPVAARSLAGNSARLKDVIRSAVINGGGVESNGLEVKVMLNAISVLAR
jgi:hypothetical protein